MELQGKVIDFLGDSITEGHGLEYPERDSFARLIQKRCGLKAAYVYGIGGTRLAHQQKPSEKPRYDLCFCGRAYDLNPEADVIVVYGGTNDYGHGDAPFGGMEDTTPHSFCGGVDYLMRFLKETYPKAKTVFLTPARREGDERASQHPYKKEDAKPLKDYADVILKKGEQYQIPVLNLYEALNINPNNPEERERYTADGLHFNQEGHSRLADCVADFLKRI